ncbi:MAG: hypothetical protein DRQ37_03400, partial [Gammaproteobacteria bacterium]
IPVIKGNPAFVEELNEAISVLKSQGKIEKIAAKWLKGPLVYITEGERIAAIFGAVITATLVLVLVFFLRRNTIKRNAERNKAEKMTKASLREKEVLLQEIHHRVKNNLQVVSSMLSLQARAEASNETADALLDSERRIRVMAQVHESLYRSEDLAHVDARTYLENITMDVRDNQLNGEDRIVIKEDIDPVVLNVDRAVPIGQIVSEMLSNSMKHAFPGDKAGVINFSFKQVEGGVIKLSVSDNGVGLPGDFDIARSKSLGLQLIAALSAILEGELTVSGSPGASFQLSFEEMAL